MDASLQRVISALEEIARVGVLWPEGLLNPGGPHRRLKGHHYPISIGEDECLVFGKLIEELRPEHCYIIGNAFGFSSAYIGKVMKNNGGKTLVTLDDQSEGDGRMMASIAQKLVEKLGIEGIVTNKKGRSPEDVPGSVDRESYDLIFIDGLHRHPQVTRDFHAVLPYAHPSTLIVFHDSWIVGVPEAVQSARQQGFRCLWIPTSCEMILATRDSEKFERLRELFPDGVENRARRSYLYGYGLHLKEVFSYNWNRLLGRDV